MTNEEKLERLNRYYNMIQSTDEEMRNLGVELFTVDYGKPKEEFDVIDVKIAIAKSAYELGLGKGKEMRETLPIK